MNFQKSELQYELREFLVGFSKGVQRIYGSNKAGGLLGFPSQYVGAVDVGDAKVEDTMLWKAVSDMFDFGIEGRMIDGRDLGEGHMLDADFTDVEMFLRGLGNLEQFLDEDETRIPQLALLTVCTAVARHTLEGGDRYTGFSDEDAVSGELSFYEMALLANMDERSVRNAANPKLSNPLVTVARGKRTFVERHEALRWLAERKGFVPTRKTTSSDYAKKQEATESIQLPVVTAERLRAKAIADGTSVERLIAQLLAQ